MAFALLARLRYLNLRANCFTVFPEVVRENYLLLQAVK